ncbi:MAG TPA: RNA methyltransferase [Candidatus Paceibacterota bacterium]|nr:RNA methyltransferase [Candidatus Paceibacterota bacterium]
MLTKGRAKFIESLKDKKFRTERKLFIVEGEKSVAELLNSDWSIDSLFLTKSFASKYDRLLKQKKYTYETVEKQEIEKMGSFGSNDAALAVVRQKPASDYTVKEDEIVLALSDIRDPGNLGTIIRIADWFGVKTIIASPTTVDFYNNKVISASMGSFLRVQVIYKDLEKFLSETKFPVYGAVMKGQNVHETKFPKGGILLLGNESNGIGRTLEALVKNKITIPRIGEAESLNAAIATAIILDNWRRN